MCYKKHYKVQSGGLFKIKDYINLTAQKVSAGQKGKAQYRVGGRTVSVERAAMFHYKKNGYQTIFSENVYWWHLMGLLFWDVIFARVKGAVRASGTEGYAPVHSKRFADYFDLTIKTNGMPADFFSKSFYANRQALIKKRIRELENKDLSKEVHKNYLKHYGKNFRLIENWSRYSPEELSVAARLLPAGTLLCIIERLLEDVSGNRSGLSDLLVYDDHTIFFAEVKGDKDRLTNNQLEWMDFLKSLGVDVQICFINKTDKQIENEVARIRADRKNAKRKAENITRAASNKSTAKKSGCYIATAVYGDYNAPQVAALRHYRDAVLLKTIAGRIIVKLYYSISPGIAAWLTSTVMFNATVRMVLDQVVMRICVDNKELN
jgi:hypothetical protein